MKPFSWTSRSFFFACLACSGLACAQASAPSAAVREETETETETDSIIGGKNDPGDPSVVALFGQLPDSDEGFLCTGAIIAPSVVLTAAHCVSPLETPAGTTFEVIAGASINHSKARRLAVRSVHPNPRWSPDNLEAGHDQGIVVLSAPSGLTPLPFNRQALASSLVGKPLRIVGYGLNDGVAQTGAGVKRQALTSLRAISANLIRIGDPRRGTCSGDSGGPAFMDVGGVETIVGTTSYGNFDCTDGGFDARVDRDLAFIEPYLSDGCVPACDGRACGGDGCGGSCGACQADDSCSSEGQCLPPAGGCDSGAREAEPNDSALQANPLCAGGVSNGMVTSAGDQDWFSWTVNPDVVYTVSITPATSDPALRVYKVAATGRLTFIGDGPTVARHTEAGGSYVARIMTTSSAFTAYTLTVSSAP